MKSLLNYGCSVLGLWGDFARSWYGVSMPSPVGAAQTLTTRAMPTPPVHFKLLGPIASSCLELRPGRREVPGHCWHTNPYLQKGTVQFMTWSLKVAQLLAC